MRDLNYQLKLLCKHSHEGSFETRVGRERQLSAIANQLHDLGFRQLKATSLKQKHVQSLVDLWLKQNLSPGTIKNRMSCLRWWAEKVNKRAVVAGSNDFYGIPDRQFVSDQSKAKDLAEEQLALDSDALAQIWGRAEHTSSDGQFFPSRRNAGEINAKYGPDPGLKIYSFLSGQYGSFHSDVIGATVGEAPFVLDGLMGNVAQFNPLLHYVDTGGVSDHVFALFHLLGLSLAPRLRDFPDRRLACFGKASAWKRLAPIMGRPIQEEAVLGHWDDALRLAVSTQQGTVKPSAMLRKLGAYRQQNRFYLALGEIGRVRRTLFMLDWIEDPKLRMECQGGLNKGEARHSLAKAVFAHSQGRIYDRSALAQQKRAMARGMSAEKVNGLRPTGLPLQGRVPRHIGRAMAP